MKADIEPGWFTIQNAATWSGLSTRSIELLISDGRVVSRQVNIRSTSGGRRLVKRESLNDYIEASISSAEAKTSKKP